MKTSRSLARHLPPSGPRVLAWTACVLALSFTPARAEVDPRGLLLGLSGDSVAHDGTVADLLWSMASDPAFADAVLARATTQTPRALTDTLLCFLRLKEPAARELLPDLYRIRDGGPPRAERPPAWSDVQWQGVRLLRVVAPDSEVGRDLRLIRELDAAMAKVDVPRPAAVNGAVLVLDDWWAERGEDPRLTHDPARIVDVTPWMERLERADDDPLAWKAPWMLADLDGDKVLRERVIARLTPERHAFLVAELAETVQTLPDSLAAMGIDPPRWDPQTQQLRGHAAIDLWRLSMRMLEIVTDEPISGADDTMRRLTAMMWWDRHRLQARYYRDPRQAPDLRGYFTGLQAPEDRGGQNAGAWARSLYIEPSVADVVLDRIGDRADGMVAELVSLLTLDRASANRAGFTMAMRRRFLNTAPGSPGEIVGIDWEHAREFLRRVLTQLTAMNEPERLSASEAERFWLDWWDEHRSDPRWWREDPPSGRR